jgi:hypothetical protein
MIKRANVWVIYTTYRRTLYVTAKNEIGAKLIARTFHMRDGEDITCVVRR